MADLEEKDMKKAQEQAAKLSHQLEQLGKSCAKAGSEFTKRLSDPIAKFGKVCIQAADSSGTLGESYEAAFGQLTGAIGAAVLPQVARLTDEVNGVLEGLAAWAGENPELVGTLAAVAGAAALAGPALAQIAGAMELCSAMGALLGSVFSPVTLILAGVAAAVVALGLAWEQNLGGIRDSTTQGLATVAAMFQEQLPAIQALFGELWAFCQQIWQEVGAPVFGVIGRVAKLLMETFAWAFPIILTTVQMVFQEIRAVWDNVLKPVFDFFMAIVSDSLASVEEDLPAILAVFQETFEAVSAVWSFFRDAFVEVCGSIRQFFLDAWNGIVTFASETIPQLISDILAWFENLPYNLGLFLGEIIVRFQLFAADCAAWAGQAGQTFVDNLIQWFMDLPGKVTEWLGTVRENIEGWIGELKLFLEELPDKLTEIGKSIMDGLWDGLKSVWEEIYSWFEGIVEKVENFFQEIKEGMSKARSESASSRDGDGDGGGGGSRIRVRALASGGILTRATVFGMAGGAPLLGGEAGPEAVIPLARLPEVMRSLGAQGGVTVNIQSPRALTAAEAARQFKRAQRSLALGVI